MMSVNEKISKALKSATTHLENSIMALNKKDENSLMDNVWHLAAALEYALFMFSIIFQDESDKPEWKPNPKVKKVEVDSALATAQDLLKEADKHVADKNLREAYQKAYVARHYVLKVQGDFAKRKREAAKSKEATPPRESSSP